ncbi:WEB family protein [Iris pallida]|uniref:C2 and GRAM domain-containing protein n=1 Tax=Iris pallida TaxID=29817 RepID=A0AAX6GRY5_IRIPA|nr:C2 and GRAM domain-containing protein [Iris pallida]KAJ6831519.1 WEB family protein [Iris pallida]
MQEEDSNIYNSKSCNIFLFTGDQKAPFVNLIHLEPRRKSDMGMKTRKNSFDSPKAEVGEIDTRAPFASVKAAVSLFGEVAFSAEKTTRKPKPSTPEQKAFATETQLHLAQKELNKFKEQLHNAETTRAQALSELEKAKKTVDDLTHKLAIINESKQIALKVTEVANNQTNQLKDEVSSPGDQTGKIALDRSREQYADAIAELDSAKQELRRIRKDFEAAVEAKIAAFTQESEAKQKSEVNADKADQLSKEITSVQESLVHVKLATEQAKQDKSKIRSEKDSMHISYQQDLEETEKKLVALKEDFNPELHKELELKLVEADAEIKAVRKELDVVGGADHEAVTIVTTELDGAKEVLQKVAEEESSLRSLVESLKLELEAVMKEHNHLKEKDNETEALIGNLHNKIQKCKAELEAAMAAESKASLASAELMSALQQLTLESEGALQEAEAMKKEAEAMRNEAESARDALAETEKKLEAALKAAEEAKSAEAQALDKIKNLSARKSAARSSTSVETGAVEITISKEEYESLRQKVEESEKLTEMKVAAAVAQVEAVKASESEAEKRLEAAQKEIEEMESATEEALKRADMAEAAKRAVENELRRWREKEQKKAAELAAQILAETEVQPVATEPSPPAGKQPTVAATAEQNEGTKKASKGSSKKTLLPSLSSMFQRKKSHVDRGSPSHSPGQKVV